MSEPLYRFTYDAYRWLCHNIPANMEHYQNPDADFGALLERQFPGGYRTSVPSAHITGDLDLEVADSQRPHAADMQALDFYGSFEGMTPKLASDTLVTSYLNHLHLHRYGMSRWPSRNETEVGIFKHWLGSSGRDIYEQSISGRTWWIAHTAATSAAESGGMFTAEQALAKFVESPEYYHRTMQYAVLRNPALRAECIRALLNEADGISRDGYREIAMDLNREAGARLLDSLSRPVMRGLVQRSAVHKMSVPEYVPDRKRLQNKKKLRVLSLGAGAQSTVLALMAEEGWDGLERPDIAIFADTQWEPPGVYEHLDWLEQQVSYKIVRVSAGNIRDNILRGVSPEGYRFLDVPVFLVNRDGTKSVAARQCTAHYKINPITQELRRMLGIPAGRRAPKDVEVEMWMGISTDESTRIKQNRTEWITNRYPLVEMDMSRANIYNWFHERYPGRHLPRSACVGCPYHSDMEWKWLKDNEPESFRDAVYVDWALRNVPEARGTIKGTAFLHHGRSPLDTVDLRDTEDYDSFMANECEGLCGV